jgi:signal transduction histidine kinase
MNGSASSKTLGLLGMKERAGMLGGQFEIISEPGKGTIVFITVPLQQEVTA